jgi:hypothetical protein
LSIILETIQELISPFTPKRKFRSTTPMSTMLTYLLSWTMLFHLSWYQRINRLSFSSWRSAAHVYQLCYLCSNCSWLYQGTQKIDWWCIFISISHLQWVRTDCKRSSYITRYQWDILSLKFFKGSTRNKLFTVWTIKLR